MHDGRGLVGAALVHRPHPLQLQIVDIAAIDLLERAVTPAGIIAAADQPLAIRRVGQHGVGHGRIVLNVADHGLAEAADHARAIVGAGRRTTVIRVGAAARPGSSRRLCRPDPTLDVGRHSARCHGGDFHCCRWCKGGRARGRAIGLQYESHQACVGRRCQTARIAVGHGGADGVVEIGGGAIAPRGDEGFSGQGQRIAFTAQIGLMATDAVGGIGAASGIGLGGRERTRRLGQDRAAQQGCTSRQQRQYRN